MRIGKLGLECPDRFITVVEFVAVKAPRSHKDQHYGRPTNYCSLWQFYRRVRRI
jgi:hypothetical protein